MEEACGVVITRSVFQVPEDRIPSSSVCKALLSPATEEVAREPKKEAYTYPRLRRSGGKKEDMTAVQYRLRTAHSVGGACDVTLTIT